MGGASEDGNSDSTSPAFWRASANAVEAKDLSDPATFEDATSRRISFIGARRFKLN